MIRKVFFSFHFERDAWRAAQVRNSGLTKEVSGFLDVAEWQEVSRKGEYWIQKWINDQLIGTSVTIVLIGAETSNRPYVMYELEQSWKRGNGILGVYIHNIKNQYGEIDRQGNTNFGDIFRSSYDHKKYFYERFNTYDWVYDYGRNNIDYWIETAAVNAGR